MATKKSSTTKAKTKTTKSKAPQKTTKTAAAKTANKSSAKAVSTPAAKSAAPASKPTKATNLLGLRRLHMLAVGLFAILAVAAGLIMGSDSYQLTVGHLAKDGLAEGTVLVPAVQALYDVEVRWIVVAAMVFSAVLPLLYVTKLENRYSDYLQNSRMVPFRWLDLAVTGALMVETTALLSGVQDLFVLKLVGGLVALSFLLGLIAERQNNGVQRMVSSAFSAGILSAALPWVLIVAYAISTVVYGATSSPWYVYALYAALVAGMAAIICIQATEFRRRRAAWQQNYLLVERNYLAVTILTKVAFAAILIAGLLR